MVWVSSWNDVDDALLMHKRDDLHMRWGDVALEMGRSDSTCHRRWKELTAKKPQAAPPMAPAPRRRSLHERLGIRTHVHRQAILADPRIGQWDAVNRVWSFNHLFRESITLAGT